MAGDAAERLLALIADGREIPYEVREPGDGSPLCRYEPQTEVFVYANAAELRDLDSFGAACAAIETPASPPRTWSGWASAFPRSRASAPRPPASPSCAGSGWAAPTSRSSHLEAAIGELEVGPDVAAGEIEVIVPLRGLQMPSLDWTSTTSRSSGPTRSTCPPRRARAMGSGSRHGSPRSSRSSASTRMLATVMASRSRAVWPRSLPSAGS